MFTDIIVETDSGEKLPMNKFATKHLIQWSMYVAKLEDEAIARGDLPPRPDMLSDFDDFFIWSKKAIDLVEGICRDDFKGSWNRLIWSPKVVSVYETTNSMRRRGQ